MNRTLPRLLFHLLKPFAHYRNQVQHSLSVTIKPLFSSLHQTPFVPLHTQTHFSCAGFCWFFYKGVSDLLGFVPCVSVYLCHLEFFFNIICWLTLFEDVLETELMFYLYATKRWHIAPKKASSFAEKKRKLTHAWVIIFL